MWVRGYAASYVCSIYEAPSENNIVTLEQSFFMDVLICCLPLILVLKIYPTATPKRVEAMHNPAVAASILAKKSAMLGNIVVNNLCRLAQGLLHNNYVRHR